jgi:hypothetical protein
MWRRFFNVGDYQIWVSENDDGPVYQATKFYGECLDFADVPQGDGGYYRLSQLLERKGL